MICDQLIQLDRDRQPKCQPLQNSEVPESLHTRENECHPATFVQTTHGSPPLQDPPVRFTSISCGQPTKIHWTHRNSPPITPPKQLSKAVGWLLIYASYCIGCKNENGPKRLVPIAKNGSEVFWKPFFVRKCVDVALFSKSRKFKERQMEVVLAIPCVEVAQKRKLPRHLAHPGMVIFI